MEKEIWKDVIDYPEYFMVSSFGRVWSKRTNKILKQGISKSGYLVISTKIGGRKGKSISKKVHRWVGQAFIDNPENKPFVNHKDGDKTNNFWKNLEWCTSSENQLHSFKNGLNFGRSGESHNCCKLKREEVELIRKNYIPYDKNFGTRALARYYGISHKQISSIVNYKKWIT